MKNLNSNIVDNSVQEQIKTLYELMQTEKLEELEIKQDNLYIHIKRKGANSGYNKNHAPAVTTAVVVENQTQDTAEDDTVITGETIKSPITGILYRAPSPSSPPFINEGDIIDAGKTLCIIEAMKVMNEIKADKRIKILKILVENGKPVTANLDLFLIEKA